MLIGKDKRNEQGKQTVRQLQRSMTFPEHVLESLSVFGLQPPLSSRGIQQVIERLEIEETCSILTALAMTFPCPRCETSLSRGLTPRQTLERGSKNKSTPMQLNLEMLGQRVGT